MKTNKKIVRKFRGMPYREAKASLKVQPDQEDIDHAERGNPTECVYALCLKRILHTDSVFIYRRIAFVGTLDEKGNKIFERYQIRSAARKVIDTLDQKGNEHLVPAGFIFHPPSEKETLDYRITREKRKPSREHKSKQILGSMMIEKSTKPKHHSFSNFRSGTGMVTFRAKKEEEKMTIKEKKHAHDITTTN